jgi:hypothetical protein
MRLALFAVSLIATAAPALAQDFAAPRPPEGAAPNQAVPLRDASGAYATPNRDIGAAETSWHVRAALNVAALGCRGADEAATVAGYNRMIARHRAPLADADGGVKAAYRARFGARWESEHDARMTRLYNFFAQPPAQRRFCGVAREILAELDQVQPAQYALYAAEALPRLEAPFTDFYRAYDAYRVDYAAWQARGPAAPVTAVAALAPASPAPAAVSLAIFP